MCCGLEPRQAVLLPKGVLYLVVCGPRTTGRRDGERLLGENYHGVAGRCTRRPRLRGTGVSCPALLVYLGRSLLQSRSFSIYQPVTLFELPNQYMAALLHLVRRSAATGAAGSPSC